MKTQYTISHLDYKYQKNFHTKKKSRTFDELIFYAKSKLNNHNIASKLDNTLQH